MRTTEQTFWSSSVARAPAQEVSEMLAGYRAQPQTWLARAGLEADEVLLKRAQVWLEHQPAGAQSVVAITGASDYPQQLQRLFEQTPEHLLGG